MRVQHILITLIIYALLFLNVKAQGSTKIVQTSPDCLQQLVSEHKRQENINVRLLSEYGCDCIQDLKFVSYGILKAQDNDLKVNTKLQKETEFIILLANIL